MSAIAHAPAAQPKEERFKYTNLGPVFFGLLVAAAVGLAVCLVSFFVPNKVFVPYDFDAEGHPLHGPHAQFLFSWLFAFMFFFTISAGALFWTMLHYAVDAEWSVVVRRILETMANSFRWLWLAFLPIVIWAPNVYRWMITPLSKDPALAHKAPMLNQHTWAVFTVVIFAFFFTASYTLRWLSVRQDATGDPGCTTRSRKVAFASIPVFGILLTAAAIFWAMSIQYHWYSTMWGVYIFAGSAWSSMATLIIITYLLRSAGYLQGVVSTEHFHIMGKLLLSFTVFWAYISFSQFFLIWYANIPEETEYFLIRNTEGWNTWAIWLEVVGHFFVTFALLCPRVMKTNMKYLAGVACWVLLMHAADMYFIISPFLHPKGVAPLTMIVDLAALAAIGAPLAIVFIRALGRHSLYAIRDPRLPESLRLVN